MKTILLRSLLIVSVSAVSISAAAFEADVASATNNVSGGNDIVVTGSRIARPELDSPMPVSVISMNEAENLGINTAWAALIRDPAIAPGIGRGNAGGQSFDGGTASIDLRKMGSARTLTLINGQRRVSGSARSSAVDLNMIPAGMIERIEVITGGAAAIYGADAVTGAVNVITKKDIQGVEIKAMQSISERGDAPSTTISALAGTRFGNDRGGFSVGATYVNSKGIFTQDRDFSDRHMVYQSNPANTSPTDGIPDSIIYDNWAAARLNQFPTFVHKNVNYVLLNDAVKQQNIDFVSAPGEYVAGATPGYYVDGTFPINSGEMLVSPLEQFAASVQLDYDLTDNIKLNSNFDYGHTFYNGTKTYYREDSRATWLNGLGGATAKLDNPYLPNAIRDFMLENGLDELRLARIYPEFGLRRDVHKRNSFTIANELSGSLMDSIKWSGFFQYGQSINNVSNPGTLRANRWATARDVIANPVTGMAVCRDETARAAGCTPYNVFGNAAPTADQRAYMFGTRHERWKNAQTIFGGNLVGSLFALPYGDISFAVGAEHRIEKLTTTEDPLAIPGEFAHSGGVVAHAEIDAKLKVSEIYGEVVVPLLRDLPFAERLEIEAAYRYSDYNLFGGHDAWKLGATWSPVDGVTLRGVRSRSVRAPNFGELYEPINTALSNLDDPCESQNISYSPNRAANCAKLGIGTPGLASQLPSELTRGGNPNLQPETSNSITLGAIIQPRFVPGLDVTVDYWNIRIKNVITQFTGNQVAQYCVDLPTLDNIFCDAMTRDQTDPVRAIATLSTQMINASKSSAEGLDMAINYRKKLGAGTARLGIKATYLIDRQVEAVPGMSESIIKYVTGFDDPRVRATAYLAYELGKVNVAWNTQFRGASVHETDVASDEALITNRVPHYWNHDFSIGVDVSDNYRLQFGVNNVFDVSPPQVPSTYLGLSGAFDTIGRSFFVAANMRF